MICYLDDILITGRDTEEHMRNLEEVLKRLKVCNLKVKIEKCSFLQNRVAYLGHVIDAEVIHAMKQKTETIEKAPIPTNTTFLSLLNYYGNFIPNLSTIVMPLTALLQKGVKWEWSQKSQSPLEEVKRNLLTSQVLVHYNPELWLTLACDASPVGVGAGISQKSKDGSEKPIAFAY
jgi:hypothetical protein